MISRLGILRAALLSTVVAAPAAVLAAVPTPFCADLANNPSWGLAGNPQITNLTAVVTPAAAGNLAYCQVDFTDVSLSGTQYGYLDGQKSKIRVRVGLPLNAHDGGTGGVQGAWNGKVRSLGNGGFAGQVTAVTPSTNIGYVGTGTDTGHNSSVTNPAPNPDAPPATIELPPSEAGATFGLNPDGTVNNGRILDYAFRAQHHANMWGRQIARVYYGRKHTRNYYVGCSDGGREGHEMAQRFGKDFDGVVSMSPAIMWDRWGFSGGWGNYAAHQVLGTNGLDTAKFQDVNARALAACDAIDGITDGLIEDTRKCHYDANEAICGHPNANTDVAKCLSPNEAKVVNTIWNGPRNTDGSKLWVGWERGTSGVFGLTPAATGAPTLFGEQINRYWVHKDPTFDWRDVTELKFPIEQSRLTRQWSRYIGSDSTDYTDFKAHGGKQITSYGNADQIIPPRAHYTYVQRLFAANGGVSATQNFYRHFVFPGATHCGGSGMTTDLLFNALTNWVENGVEPDFLVAQVNATRTRKVCVYPNTQVYNGSGSTDDHTNFHCQANPQDDATFVAEDAGLPMTQGPRVGNHDISIKGLP